MSQGGAMTLLPFFINRISSFLQRKVIEMSYILTPNGRKPMISESVELDETIELDMDHFVEYVMENFPELTEKYIQENYEQVDEISAKLATNYIRKARTAAVSHHGTGGEGPGVKISNNRTDAMLRKQRSRGATLALKKITGGINNKTGKSVVNTKD
jgi:hypothetical protein